VLVNAAQAIPEERSSRVEARITLRTRVRGDARVAVEISDTGVGIEDDVRQRLFEPFFTTKAGDRGTGLGLFVSLGIVNGFGGKIEATAASARALRCACCCPLGTVPCPSRKPRPRPRSAR
jgi:signal transduction histidine kinase